MINGTGTRNSTRTVRKVEAPRPLKKSLSETKTSSTVSFPVLSSYNIESVDKLVILMDMIVDSILQYEDTENHMSGDAGISLTNNITHLCKYLKIFGPQLENTVYQGQLDRTCLVFREAMVRGALEYQARVHLLEILELRERSWKAPSSAKNFSNNSTNSESETQIDLSDLKNYVKNFSSTVDPSVVLGPNEVLKRSNRRDKGLKSSNKNYCKDEVIIRNSDSGKVAPTAKERMVQITGANEESVLYATRLINDTIRNNASPVRGHHSASDSSFSSEDSLVCDEVDRCENEKKNMSKEKLKSSHSRNTSPYEYKHKVLLSNCQLTITGDDYTYVTVAKAVLDDYFSNLRQSAEIASENINGDDDIFENVIKYEDSAYRQKKSLSSPLFIESHSSFPSSHSNAVDICDLSSTVSSPVVNQFSQIDEPDKPKSIEEPAILFSLPDAIHTAPQYVTPLDAVNVTKIEESDTPTEIVDENAITYTKEFILKCRTSELSQQKPEDWDYISSKFPAVIKNLDDSKEGIPFDKAEESSFIVID